MVWEWKLRKEAFFLSPRLIFRLPLNSSRRIFLFIVFPEVALSTVVSDVC